MFRKWHFLLFVLPVCGLLLAGITHASGMYRWVDEEGNVVYSDLPPPGGKAERVEQRRQSGGEKAADDESVSERADRIEQERRYREHLDDYDEQVRQVEQQNAQRCNDLRQQLESFRNQARIRAPDEETGELVYLSEEQRQARIDEYQRILTKECDS